MAKKKIIKCITCNRFKSNFMVCVNDCHVCMTCYNEHKHLFNEYLFESDSSEEWGDNVYKASECVNCLKKKIHNKQEEKKYSSIHNYIKEIIEEVYKINNDNLAFQQTKIIYKLGTLDNVFEVNMENILIK